MDTITGLMMSRTDKMLAPGDRVELSGATAEVLEVKGSRAIRIRLNTCGTTRTDGGTNYI